MISSFWSRFRERKLVQWGLAYLAGAWLLFQVFGELRDTFAFPPAIGHGLAVLLGVGFLVALVLAWYHGEKGAQRATGPELLMLAALLVLAGAAVRFVATRERSRDSASRPPPETVVAPDRTQPPERGSIAVLPFVNMSPEGEKEYFSDGMAEELIGALGRLEGLRVAGRTSSFAFAGRRIPVDEIARQLGVAHILEGSVRRSGDRLRVTARLVDAEQGFQLWWEAFDRELSDVFVLQEEIARAVARALDLRLPRGIETFRLRERPPDSEAYDLYLRGRHAWRTRTKEGLDLAARYFRQAVMRDTTFAEAYAGLGDMYLQQVGYRYRTVEEVLPRARDAIRRALAIEPRLAEAHATRGILLARVGGQRDSAEVEFRRAIELNPSYASAHHWYAVTLVELGRLEEAIAEFGRGVELDPLAPSLQGAFSNALWLKGDAAAAEERGRRARDLAPEFFAPWTGLSRRHDAQGRGEEALYAAEQAVARAPQNAYAQAHLARAHARFGDRRKALEIVARLERDPDPCAACVGDVYVALEDFDRAFQWLDARIWNNLGAFYYPKVDPLYDSLRDDLRFAAFLKESGLE